MKIVLDIADNKMDFAMQVLRSLSFVRKAKTMSESNVQLWEELKVAAKEVRIHKQGKVEMKTAQELLDEL
jgi:hypothetical protein